MRLFALLFFIVISTANCSLLSVQKTRTQNNISLLTNDSVKYWSDTWKIPLFQPYKEGGLALYNNGDIHEYQRNYENKRIIIDNLSEDLICLPSKYLLKSDTLYLKKCGWTFIFKILKITTDSLQLRELTHYNFFPDSIPIIYVKSNDQRTRPIQGNIVNPYLDSEPVRSLPIHK